MYRLLLLILLLAPNAAGQDVPNSATFSPLDRLGLSLSVDAVSDTFVAPKPAQHRSTGQQFADLSFDWDVTTAFRSLKNTHAFISFHGNSAWFPSFSNALQVPSSYATDPGVRLAELWLSRPLIRNLQLRAGKIDANRDFAVAGNATGFLNSSFGYTPTFTVLPNYSGTRWGSELFFTHRRFSAKLASFAPSQDLKTLFVEEVGVPWNASGCIGRVSFGAWQQVGKAVMLSGTPRSGDRGVYFIGEQTLWRHHRTGPKESSVAAFMNLGAAPAEFNVFQRHTAAGILWNAPFANRPSDSMGAAIARGRLSSDPPSGTTTSHETMYEIYYQAQLSRRLTLTPDFQYFVDPGGVNGSQPLLGLRLKYNFFTRTE